MNGKPYDGRYDNLLFYFKYFYNLIQNKYKQENKKYTHRQREGYIQYDEKDNAKADEDKSVDA